MPIIGFNFNKINVEKKKSPVGKINIKNNVSIQDIVKAELTLGNQKQQGVRFLFKFSSKYEPAVATISLDGEVLFIEDAKKIKEILAGWKKNKKLPDDMMANILNTILTRCNIEALVLSREVALPSPIPLPKVKPSGTQDSYIG